MVLDMEKARFAPDDTIVVGQNQTLDMSLMNDAELFVWYDKDSSRFHWKLSEPSYIKINGSNPNLHSLQDVLFFQFNDVTFTIEELNSQLLRCNVEEGYIAVSQLFEVIHPGGNYSDIRSVIAVKNRVLIYLDDSLLEVRDRNNHLLNVVKNGTSGDDMTIELFDIKKRSYFEENPGNQLFRSDTAYFAKPTPVFTAWGGSEIYCRAIRDEDTVVFEIYFDKNHRAIIPNSNIDTALARSDATLTSVRQYKLASVFDDYLYVPDYFNGIDPVLLRIESNHSHEVVAKNTHLNYYRAPEPAWVFLALLILTAMMMFLMFFFSRRINVPMAPDYENIDNSRSYGVYYAFLLGVLFLLSCFRVIIGYNLSMTPPYFPSLYHNAILVSVFVLVMVTFVWITVYALFSKVETGYRNNFYRTFFIYQVILFFLLFICAGLMKNLSGYNLPGPTGDLNFNQIISPISSFLGTSDYSVVVSYLFGSIIMVLGSALTLLKMISAFQRFSKYAPVVFVATFLVLAIILLGLSSTGNSYSLVLVSAMFVLTGFLANMSPDRDNNRKLKSWLRADNNYLFLLIILVSAVSGSIAAFALKDTGYIINLILILPFMAWLLKILPADERYELNIKKWNYRKVFAWLMIAGYFILIIIAIRAYAGWFGLSDRLGSRFTTFVDYGVVRQEGTRQSESVAEFFAVLSHYVWPSDNYNPFESYHPSIASKSDPVVVNDLSVPVALIYPFGPALWWLIPSGLLFLWVFLMLVVIRFNVNPMKDSDRYPPYLDYVRVLRILSMLMIVSNGIYLISSYYNLVPFTGRLIYGLGQDSVAEVLETILLFAVMGMVFIPGKYKRTAY